MNEYFDLPFISNKPISIKIEDSIVDHINNLWNILSRPSDKYIEGSSLIPLPYPYLVPGGRFREIFYCDSYFTMLGLSVSSNHLSLVENLINNFSYLINKYGFIPNRTRTYFLSRSQPPFFAFMIELLSNLNENPSIIRLKYLFELEKEYEYWMSGIE